MSVVHSPAIPGHMPVSNYSSSAFADKAVVSATPVIVKEVRVTNASGGTRYVHLFNAAAVPADGVAPTVIPIPITNGASLSLSYTDGNYFSTGLCWCSSTTQATKTLGGASDFWVEVDFVKAI
jgi:hypothetical protein